MFIVLSDHLLPVGTSLSGELQFSLTDKQSVLPRDYLFFDNDGAFVRTESGQEYRVAVVIDNGSSLVITFVGDAPAKPLVPNRSVRF